MNRWLKKIEESAYSPTDKADKSTSVSSVSDSTGPFAEKNEAVAPATASEWMGWITDRCPLLPEDRTHVVRGLFRLHPRLQQRLAKRYVEAWHAAADDEPKYHKRDNAGRRAANLIITHLLKGNEHV